MVHPGERRARRFARAGDHHALGRVPSSTSPTRSRCSRPVISLSSALYSYLADAGAAPVRSRASPGRPTWRPPARRSSATRASGCSWTTAPARRAPARSERPGSSTRWPGRCPGAPDHVVAGRQGRPTPSRAARPRPPPTSPIRRRARARRCRAPVTRTPGRRSPPTTGSRSRPARAWASRPRRWRGPRRRGRVEPGPRLRSSARDTDLQVTLSEVRPTGRRRTSRTAGCAPRTATSSRAARPPSTRCRRTAPRRREDAARPGGARARADLPGRPRFRAGSRVRVGVLAVGGDRPRWSFATLDRGRTRTPSPSAARGPPASCSRARRRAAQGTPLPPPTALR